MQHSNLLKNAHWFETERVRVQSLFAKIHHKYQYIYVHNEFQMATIDQSPSSRQNENMIIFSSLCAIVAIQINYIHHHNITLMPAFAHNSMDIPSFYVFYDTFLIVIGVYQIFYTLLTVLVLIMLNLLKIPQLHADSVSYFNVNLFVLISYSCTILSIILILVLLSSIAFIGNKSVS